MTALPTRKDEAWRYADLKAVEGLWPPAPATLISVAEGATAEHVLHVAEPGIHDIEVRLAPGARLRLMVAISAPDYARVALVVHLAEGSHLDLGGVLLGAGDASVELVTDIRHDEPGASSSQKVRIVVDDRATGTYLGRIAVARDAQKTDAGQSARALVLKRTAAANLKPELEIYADDVKCAHGCTVGELDKAALFYLQSRGVPMPEAQSLLTRAFLADALEGLEDEAAREKLEAVIAGFMEARA
ncbi:SufD family Fe-S cluster assembly protein [Sandaracinobacteroides sp. A072]|uniref:SufD family Fe-S cluster assembly protein n=1 Tax=Sandaracinobacteroides sp. A072 TaxID=3461146 RepID=UPI004041A93C